MQDLYLSHLITVEGVKNRRGKIPEEGLKKAEHSATFFYKLKIPDADQRGFRELSVCRVAFLAILGISRNRLRITQKMLYSQRKEALHDSKPGNESFSRQKAASNTEDMFVPEPVETLIMTQIDNYALSETYSVKDMHKNVSTEFFLSNCSVV